ncbi:MAG: helicase [Clostridia bacterium]|nr:helicase [Clostridia bacterium]
MSSTTGNLAQLAAAFVNSTERHIFLTGKAGTGKTTFLHSISQSTHKKCVIAAPTGIAAINAGGVTLHSLLQLPFGSFIPAEIPAGQTSFSVEINTPQSLLRQRRFNRNKINMLREMELLIIDEVSMLRADLLDAIDHMLRSLRRKRHIPFGGVQMLFIGDLLQLPPVIKEAEWQYLAPFYKSAYFFEAHALRENPPVYIELDKIYRQSDQQFIDLLNRFRNNQQAAPDLELLNKRYCRDFQKKIDEGYILLTTHNYKADLVNKNALQQLAGKTYTYSAEVTGEFSEHSFPVDQVLSLKKDARVMFIKNDPSGEGRYYNGRIGKIKNLDDDEIEVGFDDDSETVTVARYRWDNKRFTLNEENGEIEESSLGSFSHFPLKLAWAVTVHKSQGLTFEKAVLDLSEAFAPGQVYVALSRLTSLDGLALSSPISTRNLQMEQAVMQYSQNKSPGEKLAENLQQERQRFIATQTIRAFDMQWLKEELRQHYNSYTKDATKSEKQKYKPWAQKLLGAIDEPLEIADKFIKQIQQITHGNQADLQHLLKRTAAAKNYFEPILKDFSTQITEHTATLKSSKKTKAYLSELNDLEMMFFRQRYYIHKAEAILQSALENKEITPEALKNSGLYTERTKTMPASGSGDKKERKLKRAIPDQEQEKEAKVSTQQVSFALYKSGKTLEEIATERKLTLGTIQGHFSKFVLAGTISVEEILDKTKAEAIRAYAGKHESANLAELHAGLKGEYSFGVIRLVLADMAAKAADE